VLRHILRSDQAVSPEFRLQFPGAPRAIQLHIYQPPRKISYKLNGVVHGFPDISGEDDVPGGYNKRALQSSYMPLLRGTIRRNGSEPVEQTEFLTNPYISWNLFGVTADEIRYKYPGEWREFHEKILRAEVKPIGETYFHPIFPLLPDETKRMLIRFAKAAYRETWRQEMQFVWLPEMAVDQSTLDILSEEGIKGVLLRDRKSVV